MDSVQEFSEGVVGQGRDGLSQSLTATALAPTSPLLPIQESWWSTTLSPKNASLPMPQDRPSGFKSVEGVYEAILLQFRESEFLTSILRHIDSAKQEALMREKESDQLQKEIVQLRSKLQEVAFGDASLGKEMVNTLTDETDYGTNIGKHMLLPNSPVAGNEESTHTLEKPSTHLPGTPMLIDSSGRAAMSTEQRCKLPAAQLSWCGTSHSIKEETELQAAASTRTKLSCRSNTEELASRASKSEQSRTSRQVFCDAESMKAEVRHALLREGIMGTDHLLKHDGFPQAIVRSQWFEFATLGVISLNTIWVAMDTDLNTGKSLEETHPLYVTIDILFALYFILEWIVRFSRL